MFLHLIIHICTVSVQYYNGPTIIDDKKSGKRVYRNTGLSIYIFVVKVGSVKS